MLLDKYSMKRIISKFILFLLPYSQGIPITLKNKNWKEEKGVWLSCQYAYKGGKIIVEKIGNESYIES